MKFSLPVFTFFLLLQSFTARSQDDNTFIVDTATEWRIEVPLKDSKWQGQAKYYDKKTGILIAEFTFDKGDKNGPATHYDHETGCRDHYGNYKDNAKVGDWIYLEDCSDEVRGWVHHEFSSDSGHAIGYFPSGNIMREGEMKDGKLDGVWKQYFDAPGRLEKITNKCFSKDNGEAVFYDSLTQNVIARGTYSCNDKSGEWRYFDAVTTALTCVEYYDDSGELDGQYTSFFLNGNKGEEGYYSAGLRNGVFKYYDSATGNLLKANPFTNDTLDGKVEKFHPNGRSAMLGYYKMGIPFGFWTGYYEDGSTQYTAAHEKMTGEALLKYYAPNGKLTYTGRMKNNAKEGEWTFYGQEGKGILMRVEEYEDGMLNGAATLYYPGKIVRAKGNYKKGLADGKWKRYYPSGKLWISMVYDEGVYTGELKSYYDNGKLRRKEKYDEGNMISSVTYSPEGEEIVYTSVSNPAAYDGDMDAYFRENMLRPDMEIEEDEDGDVTVTVYIDDEGNMTVRGVNSSIPDEYDEEAVRLIEGMKSWKPATLDGFPVGSFLQVVVPFKVKE